MSNKRGCLTLESLYGDNVPLNLSILFDLEYSLLIIAAVREDEHDSKFFVLPHSFAHTAHAFFS